MKTKEDLIYKIGSPILRPLGFLQLFFILTLLSSPFIWIWVDFEHAWKTALTSVIGILLTYFAYSLFKKEIEKQVDKITKKEEENKSKLPKSAFQQRLDEAMKKQEELRNKNK